MLMGSLFVTMWAHLQKLGAKNSLSLAVKFYSSPQP